MNDDVRAKQILWVCYRGDVPEDAWVTLASRIIMGALKEARREAFETCLMIVRDYTGQGPAIAKEIERKMHAGLA